MAEFWRRGWCVLEDVLTSEELDPVRAVISRSVEARGRALVEGGKSRSFSLDLRDFAC
eukprot:SAG31_NODE_4395_length_3271_cov_3.996217_1_plen_58_part_00